MLTDVDYCFHQGVMDPERHHLIFQSVHFLYVAVLDCIEFLSKGFFQIIMVFLVGNSVNECLEALGDFRWQFVLSSTIVLNSFSDKDVSRFCSG